MRPLYADPSERAALMSLVDATWPGLAARFDAAARPGWPVGEHSTPFVTREGGRLASHVGVLDLPVMLGGRERRIAGLHGVCTLPEARRRGHGRAGPGSAPVGAEDLPWLRQVLATRAPLSRRFAAQDDGWLVGIDAVLRRGDRSAGLHPQPKVIAPTRAALFLPCGGLTAPHRMPPPAPLALPPPRALLARAPTARDLLLAILCVVRA